MTKEHPVRILAISGSLRAVSSNTSALQAAGLIAPDGMDIALYSGLANLPHFNPDLDQDPLPVEVQALRRQVAESDALLICSPEYARGVAGSLKNALDWLVSGFEFPDKPVAVINTSQRSEHADAHLRLTLQTMSARVVQNASITLPLLGRNLDADGIASDPELSGSLRTALEELAGAIRQRI